MAPGPLEVLRGETTPEVTLQWFSVQSSENSASKRPKERRFWGGETVRHQPGTLSDMNRNGVRRKLESVTDSPRNTQMEPE